MKLIVLIFILLISAPSLAGWEEVNSGSGSSTPQDIDLVFFETPVLDVVKHINSKCHDHMEPVKVNNPGATITLNFEVIHCKSAAAIIHDFDNNSEET